VRRGASAATNERRTGARLHGQRTDDYLVTAYRSATSARNRVSGGLWTSAGGMLNQVHLVGVGGDCQVVHTDHTAIRVRRIRMLRQRYDVREQRRDAHHVLVVRAARWKRQLHRHHLIPRRLPRFRGVGRGQPRAVGVVEQVGEPSCHAGGGA
jgi:hypothetical protein